MPKLPVNIQPYQKKKLDINDQDEEITISRTLLEDSSEFPRGNYQKKNTSQNIPPATETKKGQVKKRLQSNPTNSSNVTVSQLLREKKRKMEINDEEDEYGRRKFVLIEQHDNETSTEKKSTKLKPE